MMVDENITVRQHYEYLNGISADLTESITGAVVSKCPEEAKTLMNDLYSVRFGQYSLMVETSQYLLKELEKVEDESKREEMKEDINYCKTKIEELSTILINWEKNVEKILNLKQNKSKEEKENG